MTVIALLIMHGSVQATATDTEEEVKELAALRINGDEPSVDGHLNEPIWSSPELQIGRDFTQRNPDDGAPASESTLVAIAYGEHSVFVAFWCYDSEPDKIAAQLVRRVPNHTIIYC